MPHGLIPFSDGAGEVTVVGGGVSRVKPGDRVAGTFFQTWLDGHILNVYQKSALGGAVNGLMSEYVLLSENGIVMLPDYLSYEEGASLPCAAVTAWNGLVEQGHLVAGETVLLLGTGGVSMFALQIAKMHGARVIITSSSDAKLARAKSLGKVFAGHSSGRQHRADRRPVRPGGDNFSGADFEQESASERHLCRLPRHVAAAFDGLHRQPGASDH